VGDLVADLVGVPFGDRFGREGAQLAGGHDAQGTSGREGTRASRTAWATRVLEPSARVSSSPLRSRIRTEFSAAPNTPPVMSLKTSRSAPLRRAFCCASSRALVPSAPVSAANPTIAGRPTIALRRTQDILRHSVLERTGSGAARPAIVGTASLSSPADSSFLI